MERFRAISQSAEAAFIPLQKRFDRFMEVSKDPKSGHVGYEIDQIKRPAEWIAQNLDWLTPNLITVIGGTVGAIGGALSAEPDEFSKLISEKTNGRVKIHPLIVKALGLMVGKVLAGYGSDGLDGTVAQAREDIGKKGKTKIGRVLDGFFDKVNENAGALAIEHFPAESKFEKPAWFLLPYVTVLTTMVRSVAVKHGVDIEKVGSTTRGGVEVWAIVGDLVAELARLQVEWKGDKTRMGWRGKGTHGVSSTAIRLTDVYKRINKVRMSGDQDLISQVERDIDELNKLAVLGYAIGGSKLQFGFMMAKLVDVIAEEPNAYGRRFSDAQPERIREFVGDKVQVFKRGADIFIGER